MPGTTANDGPKPVPADRSPCEPASDPPTPTAPQPAEPAIRPPQAWTGAQPQL